MKFKLYSKFLNSKITKQKIKLSTTGFQIVGDKTSPNCDINKVCMRCMENKIWKNFNGTSKKPYCEKIYCNDVPVILNGFEII